MKQAIKRSSGRPKAVDTSTVSAAILMAAETSFWANGFFGTTLRKVAESANVTPQTLYARFTDKTALFEALMVDRTNTSLASVSLIFEAGAEPEQVLQAVGEHIVSTFLDSQIQRLHQLVIGEARAFPRLAKIFYEKGPTRSRDLIEDYFSKQVEAGVLKIDRVDIAAEQLIGSLLGGIMSRSTLSQPQVLRTKNDIAFWVSSAVGAFLRAHAPAEPTSSSLHASIQYLKN